MTAHERSHEQDADPLGAAGGCEKCGSGLADWPCCYRCGHGGPDGWCGQPGSWRQDRQPTPRSVASKAPSPSSSRKRGALDAVALLLTALAICAAATGLILVTHGRPGNSSVPDEPGHASPAGSTSERAGLTADPAVRTGRPAGAIAVPPAGDRRAPERSPDRYYSRDENGDYSLPADGDYDNNGKDDCAETAAESGPDAVDWEYCD